MRSVVDQGVIGRKVENVGYRKQSSWDGGGESRRIG